MQAYYRLPFSLLIMLLAQSAFAKPIDLLSAYQLAVENDANYQMAYNELMSTQEVLPQALAELLPSVNASASSADVRQETESSFSGDGKGTGQFRDEGFSVSIRQPLFDWPHFIRYTQADKQVSKAEIEYQLAEQQLILRLTERYLDNLQAEVALSLATDDMKAFAEQLDQAEQRFKVGVVAITDVHDARARYDLSVVSQIAAKDTLASKQEALKELIQLDKAQLVPLANKLPLASPEPNNIQQWGQTSVEYNLAIRMAKQDVAIAKKQIQLHQSEHYPTVDLVGSHNYNETGGGSFGTGFRNESDSIGVELNLSLFAGGKTVSLTRQAVYDHQKTLDALQSLQRATLRQARDAFRGVSSNLQRIQALERAIISNQSSLQANEAGLDVGTRTIVDVLNAQSNLSRAKLQLMEAKNGYILNVLALKAASGSLALDDIKKINGWLQH